MKAAIFLARWRLALWLGRMAWRAMPEPQKSFELRKLGGRLSAEEFAERLAQNKLSWHPEARAPEAGIPPSP